MSPVVLTISKALSAKLCQLMSLPLFRGTENIGDLKLAMVGLDAWCHQELIDSKTPSVAGVVILYDAQKKNIARNHRDREMFQFWQWQEEKASS